MATPNITREIFDGNLTRVTPQGVTNRRVVILGSASDGPMYTPVRVTSAGAAEDTFGSISDGNLVRGCKEALDAQAGFPKNPNVWGMRIGGSIASRSSKSITDASNDLISLLELESINEGSVYNDIYMSVDTGTSEISIWNPKLKVFTKYKYNWTDPADNNADVHNLQELVDAINADRNLSSILFAATPSLEANVEIGVQEATTGSFVTKNAASLIEMDLNQVTGGSTIDADGAIWQDANLINGSGKNDVDVSKTVKQRFRDVLSAYSIYVSDFVTISKGSQQHAIADGFILNNNTATGGVRSILNMSEVHDDILGASTASQALYSVVEKGAKVDLDGAAVWGDSITTPETIVTSLKVKYDIEHPSLNAYYGSGPYTNPYAAATLGQAAGSDVKLEIQIDGGGWVDVFDAAGFSDSWTNDGTTATVELTIAQTAKYGDTNGAVLWDGGGTGLLETEGQTVEFRVSFVTEPITLSEQQTLAAIGSDPNKVFLQGNTINFGAGPSEDLLIRHAKVKYYNPSEMATTIDSSNGTAKLTIYDNFNKTKTAAVDYSDHKAIFGLKMRYYGDVTDLSGSYYLSGGTNGTNMTNAQLYDDLDVAYDHFSDDFFDIMTVMGATFDADKVAPNAQGNFINQNAGFHTQMSDFLNAFNGEMIGVMGFEPIVGSGVGGRILKSDVDSRVGTIPAFLESFHQPFMFAADIEGIYSASGTRYGANSSPAIAGLIAAIPVEEALYRYTVPGILGMVWKYSEIDKLTGRKQIDILSDARICTGQLDNGVKLTEAKTLAVTGSDFENLMTVLILQQTLDLCRTVAKNYIGKVSSAALIQAFQAELNTAIGEALVPKALRGFNAPISMTPGERVVGKLTIPLTLSPQFEIRDVHYTVTLTADDIVG